MYYSKINECDIANGSGVRVSVFVSGCTNHCEGCFQPETWDFKYGKKFTGNTIGFIVDLLKRPFIKGLSILGGEPSKDGHHYLILAKHSDSYDIFYDGSILQNYGAPIGDVRSDATLQLFATDVGENVLLEKTSGTIEVLRVYDSALTRDECFKLYRELQTPW